MLIFILFNAIVFIVYITKKYEQKQAEEYEAKYKLREEAIVSTMDNLREEEKKQMKDWLTEDIVKYILEISKRGK